MGEDPDTTRANETIGYIVIESGSGQIDGLSYTAAVGGDVIGGFNWAFPNTYNIPGVSSADAVIATQAGMDGNPGGWAVLDGDHTVNGDQLNLAVDEDQAGDPGRQHTSEQVAYFVLF